MRRNLHMRAACFLRSTQPSSFCCNWINLGHFRRDTRLYVCSRVGHTFNGLLRCFSSSGVTSGHQRLISPPKRCYTQAAVVGNRTFDFLRGTIELNCNIFGWDNSNNRCVALLLTRTLCNSLRYRLFRCFGRCLLPPHCPRTLRQIAIRNLAGGHLSLKSVSGPDLKHGPSRLCSSADPTLGGSFTLDQLVMETVPQQIQFLHYSTMLESVWKLGSLFALAGPDNHATRLSSHNHLPIFTRIWRTHCTK
mmetsp:Transcript_3648/g.10296  ORF Transcript_3648/g.10296 Transcript_3648/m.10296 type:complete len:249 (-) Transcript_3648:33-779(-)